VVIGISTPVTVCAVFVLEDTSPQPKPVMLGTIQILFRDERRRDLPVHVSAGRQWISKAGQHGEQGSKKTNRLCQRIGSLCSALPYCRHSQDLPALRQRQVFRRDLEEDEETAP